ncbi:MAG: hypothetical protein AB8B55_15755 [Mariniblastus sp.]
MKLTKEQLTKIEEKRKLQHQAVLDDYVAILVESKNKNDDFVEIITNGLSREQKDKYNSLIGRKDGYYFNIDSYMLRKLAKMTSAFRNQ